MVFTVFEDVKLSYLSDRKINKINLIFRGEFYTIHLSRYPNPLFNMFKKYFIVSPDFHAFHAS